VEGLWERRIGGSIGVGSKDSYGTGARRWCKEAELQGYYWFLTGANVSYDINCILFFIDKLAADPDLCPDSVSQYLTHAKFYLRTRGCTSEALGVGKEHHPLVSRAMKSVRVEDSESGRAQKRVEEKGQVQRLAIPPSVVGIARRVRVPRVVYVGVVMGRTLMLRGCEYARTAKGKVTQHLLRWEHIGFLSKGKLLLGGDVCIVCADTMTIIHTSRKWQLAGHTRRVPDRVRKWHSKDPTLGLWEDSGGCVVAVLQAWCIFTNGWFNRATPVCSAGVGEPVLEVSLVNALLKEWAPEMDLNPAAVVAHCLRHGGITDLLDGGLNVEDVRIAAGSKTTNAIIPYVHPGARVAEAVSSAMVKAVAQSGEP